MPFNSMRHFFLPLNFSTLGVCLVCMARDFNCPRVVWPLLLLLLLPREEKKIINARKIRIRELRAKTFGRWSVDRQQHAGHYNWHTMCMRCKWYTRKWYTSFDCFTLAHFSLQTKMKWEKDTRTKLCFIMSYFYGACLQ